MDSMQFTVTISPQSGYEVVELQDHMSGAQVQLYSLGALLNAFVIPTKTGTINGIDGFSSINDAIANATAGFKSSKLSPFVCRLQHGKYSFDQKEYKIEGFYLGEHAIHGLLFNAPFTVTDTKTTASEASVTFSHHYKGTDPGYPFPFTLHVKWKLTSGNTLQVFTTATNNHSSAIPFSDGWHPYFSVGDTIDTATLSFTSNKQLEFSEDLLPTGNLIEDNRFIAGQKMEGVFLDNCFLLDMSSETQQHCTLKNESVTLTIAPNKQYPYLQIYTPPHRKSIAIENLTSAPDSFNNGIGLLIIEPNHTLEFSTTYTLTANK
jgi:aldose 1-epimerase